MNDSMYGLRDLRSYGNDFQFLKGHYPFGYEKYLSKDSPVRLRKFMNLVALRDPIDQMVSYYYYKIQVNQVEQYGAPPRPDSPSPIVDFYRERPLICNIQTRMIAGVHWCNRRFPVAHFGKIVPSFMYYVAWKNLIKKFHWVFFQDTADEDFAEFASCFGLKYKPNRYEKTVTKARPSKNEITETERLELLNINAIDQRLYENVKSWRGDKALVRQLRFL